MKRKNFLRQMAVTVPVGLAAPNLLFGETAAANKENSVAESLIVVTDGSTSHLPEAVSRFTCMNTASLAQLQFDKGSFLLTDKAGKLYRSAKLVFSGNIHLSMKNELKDLAFFRQSPDVVIEFGEAKRSTGLLALNSYRLPQYHVRRAENFRKENLDQFLANKRTAVMRLV